VPIKGDEVNPGPPPSTVVGIATYMEVPAIQKAPGRERKKKPESAATANTSV